MAALNLLSKALDAMILPLFKQTDDIPVPRGVAKFCSADSVAEAVLLAQIFQTINTR